MFNYNFGLSGDHRPDNSRSALEIAVASRETERRLALQNAIENSIATAAIKRSQKHSLVEGFLHSLVSSILPNRKVEAH